MNKREIQLLVEAVSNLADSIQDIVEVQNGINAQFQEQLATLKTKVAALESWAESIR